MEEAKYYTPAIEEFHIGFEIETLDLYGNWVKETCNWGSLDCACDDHEHNVDDFKNEYRVKYLDSDDITDLVFAQVYVPNCNSEDDDIQYGFELEVSESCYILLHFMGDKVSIVKQDIYDSVTSNWTAEHLFLGVINNKSELKQLLKQFEICQK